MGGVAAGLAWSIALRPTVDWLITVPVDVPFLPADLVERLIASDDRTQAVVAASGNRRHYSIAAWRPSVLGVIDIALETGAVSIRSILEQLNSTEVVWPVSKGDPFFNINTPDDLAAAEQHLNERRS